MAAAVGLRADYDAVQLRSLAKRSKDDDQTRRLLALAVVYDGGSRSEGAQAGGVGLQTFRDWVLRFNTAGPAGLLNAKAPGQSPRLDAAQRRELAQRVEDGPIPASHGVVRWRLSDLVQWVYETYRTSLSEQTLGRYLRSMGYRKLSARPRHHAQSPEAVVAFKKIPRPSGGDRGARCPRQADRGLVSGRSQDRPEEQDHAPLGKARLATIGAA